MPRGPGNDDSASDDDVWSRAARRRRHRMDSPHLCTPPPKQPREQDSSEKLSTYSRLLAASDAPLASALLPLLPTEPMSRVQQQPNQTPAMTGDMKQQPPSPTATAGKVKANATPKVRRGPGKAVKSGRSPKSAKAGQETRAVI